MVLLADVPWPSLLPLAAVIIVIMVLLRRLRRYRSRQKPDKGYLIRTPRPKSGTRSHHLDTPDDVLRWEVEMHEIARDFSAQIDNKASVLGHLIREADRAAARLEAALEAAAANSTPADEQPAQAPPLETLDDALGEEIQILSNYGYDRVEIARRLHVAREDVDRVLDREEP